VPEYSPRSASSSGGSSADDLEGSVAETSSAAAQGPRADHRHWRRGPRERGGPGALPLAGSHQIHQAEVPQRDSRTTTSRSDDSGSGISNARRPARCGRRFDAAPLTSCGTPHATRRTKGWAQHVPCMRIASPASNRSPGALGVVLDFHRALVAWLRNLSVRLNETHFPASPAAVPQMRPETFLLPILIGAIRGVVSCRIPRP